MGLVGFSMVVGLRAPVSFGRGPARRLAVQLQAPVAVQVGRSVGGSPFLTEERSTSAHQRLILRFERVLSSDKSVRVVSRCRAELAVNGDLALDCDSILPLTHRSEPTVVSSLQSPRPKTKLLLLEDIIRIPSRRGGFKIV
jgi:hypothetical protein